MMETIVPKKESALKSRSSMIIAVVILLGLGFWIPSHFSFTRTRSLDHRLFYIDYPRRGETVKVRTGSHVMFQIDHALISDLIRETKTNRIIKKVVCEAGRHLKVEDRNFYCDGKLLGRALERTPGGAAIQPFRYQGIIPRDKFFVMGSTPDSFDSRYFGFVDKGSIIALAYPVI